MKKVNRTKTKICLEIETCKECPFSVEERHWTSDSWEHAFDYYCKLTPDTIKFKGKIFNYKNFGDNSYKKIAGYVEWDSEMPNVPEWCPIRIN